MMFVKDSNRKKSSRDQMKVVVLHNVPAMSLSRVVKAYRSSGAIVESTNEDGKADEYQVTAKYSA